MVGLSDRGIDGWRDCGMAGLMNGGTDGWRYRRKPEGKARIPFINGGFSVPKKGTKH